MLNEGIFDMQKFVDGGWVTALKYEEEVNEDLKKRTGGKKTKLRSVSMLMHNMGPANQSAALLMCCGSAASAQ